MMVFSMHLLVTRWWLLAVAYASALTIVGNDEPSPHQRGGLEVGELVFQHIAQVFYSPRLKCELRLVFYVRSPQLLSLRT